MNEARHFLSLTSLVVTVQGFRGMGPEYDEMCLTF